MKGIYRFKVNCGRMGMLDGVFVAEKSDVDELAGKNVYFGEVLGKHSDIDVDIKADMLTLLSDTADDVAVFERLKMATGFNPFDYIDAESQP